MDYRSPFWINFMLRLGSFWIALLVVLVTVIVFAGGCSTVTVVTGDGSRVEKDSGAVIIKPKER
jgi:hypothetical protein